VAALLGGGAALLAGGWLLSRPQLARWQVQQGDKAYLAFTKLADESRLQQAGEAWQRARALDPRQPEAHARLGFLADIHGELSAAEAHWKQAATLAPTESPQARSFRSGLADVLAQQPGRRKDALDMYDADRFYPRSAIEASMLRWSEPAQVAQALEAISERALGEALADDGPAEAPWGFKANGGLLLFESRAHQRCLLASVRTATARLAGDATTTAPPLAAADCQGVQESVKELLCDRLQQARANPRAAATGRWLGCPPAAARAAQGKGAA
jgi:tetratricopeptide (TPR) repeat protein